MADNNESQDKNAPKSLLGQIKAEAVKAKKDAAKAKLKKLYEDYNKAVEVVEGIEQQIVDVLKSVGEDENTIRSLLTE